MATVSPALELVVRAALEAQVRELVDQLAPEVAAAVIAERLNGSANRTRVSDVADAPAANRRRVANLDEPAATKVCRSCNETKASSGFEKGRLQCKACRRDAARHRANGNAAEVAAIPLEQP